MRLLLLNWRDPWHPKAGGAEVLTQRVLERLARRGWDVEWFSARYAGARKCDEIEGVRYVRQGTQVSVHARAFSRYRGRRDFDVVIDQVNTIPFYGMSYGLPSIAWFQQLAREVWIYEAPRPVGWLGYRLEPMYLAPYRTASVITISPSTAESLRQIGFRGPIRVIPMATDEAVEERLPLKGPQLDVVVVGRVTPSKRIEESVRSAAILREKGWAGRLHVVGAGEPRYRERLRALARQLGVEDRVIFHGRVSAERRGELLRTSAALWMTSVREGWGLVVTEAAAKGTPAIVYDVPGLRDAVESGVGGLVVPPDPSALATATKRVFANLEGFATSALESARRLSWDRTSEVFETHVRELHNLA